MGDCYVIYRLPNNGMVCRVIELDLREVRILETGWQDENLLDGFAIVPFEFNSIYPSVYFPTDKEMVVNVCDVESEDDGDFCFHLIDEEYERILYHSAFAEVKSSIDNGEVEKVVLARSQQLVTDNPVSGNLLFKRACMLYPNSFVALVSTPMSGTWLMSTPEVLLEQDHGICHTMALAGTRPAGTTIKEWGCKNIAEQAFVVDFIRDCLDNNVLDLSVSSPKTIKAGFVEHIQSDFTFRLRKGQAGFQQLIRALHPTPAVCGVPCEAAHSVIQRAERSPRSYYSGYCGIFRIGAPSHVYVSLRCMSLNSPKSFTLYSGGGIVSESLEDDEWNETKKKMQTMMHLFNNTNYSS